MKELWSKLACFWRGHRWNGVHGFENKPIPNAYCYRCGKRNLP